MKLASRLLFLLLVGIIAVLVVDTWRFIREDKELLESELTRDALVLGHAMQRLLARAWAEGDERHVREIIEDVNRVRHRVRVRWVWLDDSREESARAVAAPEILAPLSRGEEVVWLDREGSGHLYCYIPVPSPGDRIGALEVARSLEPVQEDILKIIRHSTLVGLLIAVVGGGIAVLVGIVYIGRPLNRLTDKINRVGSGDLTGPVELRGHDELSTLARGLNRMCSDLAAARERTRKETEARIAALEQLRHTDRLATVGRLAAGVAHELGTPLNVASGRAGMIATGGLSEQDTAKCADIIQGQCGRMTEIIRQLLRFARSRPSNKRSADLVVMARHVIEMLEPVGRKRRVSIGLEESPPRLIAKIDEDQLQQVLTNLVMNALQASHDGGKVGIRLAVFDGGPPGETDKPQGRYAVVEVRDEGVGIAPRDLDHVFEPFFTTKDVGEGTGLGLSIAYGIVRDHGGWIEASSEVGKGSRFFVYLPWEGEYA